MIVRADLLGVTSTIRALGLKEKFYDTLLDSFHSAAITRDAMPRLWAPVVRQRFPGVLRVNGRLVLVDHPTRGKCILMATGLPRDPVQIIRLYGLRFKVERGFKHAVRTLGTYASHFWMQDMQPLRRYNANQYLHHESQRWRDNVLRKLNAYHRFVHAGIVAQGSLHYLSLALPALDWNSFGSWRRTLRPGIPPFRVGLCSGAPAHPPACSHGWP